MRVHKMRGLFASALRWKAGIRGASAYGGELGAILSKIFEQNAPAWEAFAEEGSKLFPEGSVRLLDVAAGVGEPGTTIARRLPHVQVTLSDVLEELVAAAAERSSGVENVQDCVTSDATTLDAFGEDSFDVVTCCYGIMHVDDKPAFVRAVRRVVRPGGFLLLSYWTQTPFSEAARNILDKVAPGLEPSLNPSACGRPGLVDGLLEPSFDVVKTIGGSYDFVLDQRDAFDAISSCARAELEDLASTNPDVWTRARAAFEEYCAKDGSGIYRQQDGSYVLGPNDFKLVVALKPPC